MSFRSDIENSLEFVKTEEKDQIIAQFCFPPELSFFKGHFPDRPLVPGVMQIEMAKVALERHLGHRYSLSKVKKAKFIREILPGDRIEMRGTKRDEEAEIRFKVELRVASQLVASLSLSFRRENL